MTSLTMKGPTIKVKLKQQLSPRFVVGSRVELLPDESALEIVWISRRRFECGVRRLTASD